MKVWAAGHRPALLALLVCVLLAACVSDQAVVPVGPTPDPLAIDAALLPVTKDATNPAIVTPAPAAATAHAPAPRSAALTEEVLRNGTYTLPDIGAITLSDGRYTKTTGSGATQKTVVTYELATTGDLNGDGTRDAAVILAVNTGGTGTFVYLVAEREQAGAWQQAGQQLLGDRVDVRSIGISDGQINLALLGFAPTDPQCCPSQKLTQIYKLQGDQLVPSPTPAVP